MNTQKLFPNEKKIRAICTFIKTGLEWLRETTHIHLLQIPNYLGSATELNKSQVATQSHRRDTHAAYLRLPLFHPWVPYASHRKGPE